MSISDDYRVHKISVGEPQTSAREAQLDSDEYQPTLVISIERPGMAADGHYYNMRGENISARCASFDYFLTLANCPTIAIGDGGNEIGMGNVADTSDRAEYNPARHRL